MCIKLAERKFFHETAGSATVKKTQTFPGPERADLNQGSWNDCQINSSKRNPFRKRQGMQSLSVLPASEGFGGADARTELAIRRQANLMGFGNPR